MKSLCDVDFASPIWEAGETGCELFGVHDRWPLPCPTRDGPSEAIPRPVSVLVRWPKEGRQALIFELGNSTWINPSYRTSVWLRSSWRLPRLRVYGATSQALRQAATSGIRRSGRTASTAARSSEPSWITTATTSSTSWGWDCWSTPLAGGPALRSTRGCRHCCVDCGRSFGVGVSRLAAGASHESMQHLR